MTFIMRNNNIDRSLFAIVAQKNLLKKKEKFVSVEFGLNQVMCNTSCYSILTQFAATVCSAVSSMAIINVFGIEDDKTRFRLIMAFAVTEFIIQMLKCFCSASNSGVNFEGEDFEYVSSICPSGKVNSFMDSTKTYMRVPQYNTKIKATLLGLIDFVFDAIAAVAILNGIDFVTFDSTSLLVALGTLIGLGEEIIELCLEIITFSLEFFIEKGATEKCKYFSYMIVICLGTIELIGAFIEIGISISIAASLDKSDSGFVIISIIIMSVLGCCLFCCGSCYLLASCDICCRRDVATKEEHVEEIEMY